MKKKGNFLNILLVLVFFVGLSLLLYPSVSDYWNSFHQTRAIAAYAGEVAALDDGIYDELLEAARDYNQRLAQREEPLNQSEEDLAEYGSLLNLDGSGVPGDRRGGPCHRHQQWPLHQRPQRPCHRHGSPAGPDTGDL